MTTRPWLPLLLAALWLAPVARPAAAAPRDELLRLVPGDVGFCLVLDDLRGHHAALARSPFWGHFAASPLGQKLLGDPEVQKLAAVQKDLEKLLGLPGERLRDEVLGDAVVFAFRPAQPGREEQGLFLLRARDPKVLADLVDRLNAVQQQSGQLKAVEACDHAGAKYFRRVEVKARNYYYLNGPVLVFSAQEDLLREAVSRDRQAPAGDEPPLARQLRLLGLTRRLAALWVNPRTFDEALRAQANAAQGAERVARRHLLTYWSALDGVGLALDLHTGLDLSLTLRGRPEALPPAARRLFATAARPSALGAALPDDALVAAAGRLDPAALVEAVEAFLPEENRRALRDALDRTLGAVIGADGLRQFLRNTGPDWGFYAAAPAPESGSWIPRALAAVRVQSAETGEEWFKALDVLATFLVLAHNQQHADRLRLESVKQDGVRVKALTGDRALPAGVQPAFALKDGCLVAASAPELIRAFRLPADPLPVGDEVPLVRLSLRAWHKYLAAHRDAVAAHNAREKKTSPEQAGRDLDNLLLLLPLFDRVELTQGTAPGRFALTVRVRPARPLK